MNKLEKELEKQHKGNILHRFCREIDSYVSQGHTIKNSQLYTKNKYKRGLLPLNSD